MGRRHFSGTAQSGFLGCPSTLIVLVHLVVLGVILGTAPPVLADDWGNQTANTGAHPDGSTHNWCWGSGFDTSLQDNVTSSMGDALGGSHTEVAAAVAARTIAWSTESDRA